MRPRLRAGALGLILIGTLQFEGWTTSAWAAPPEAPPSANALREASTHFRRGTTLFDEQDYAGALAEFNRAHALAPSGEALFNVGQCHYQLADYVRALSTLERYAREYTPTGERAALVRRELGELRERVGTVLLDVPVQGAQVLVDDVVVGTTPLKPFLANVGRHKVTVRADGYMPATSVVEVVGSESTNIAVALVRSTSLPPPSTATPDAPSSTVRTMGYVSLGLGGAGLITGGVFGAIALGNRSSLRDQCVNEVCPRSAQPEHDALTRNGTISTVAFVAGGAFAVLGLVLVLLPTGSAASSSTSSTGASSGPIISAGPGGLHIRY